MSTTGRRILTGLAATALLVLPGCVAWEVRDEVHSANQRIDEVDGMLIGMSEHLDNTNQRIGRTNELLEGMHATIQQTNAQLADVQATIQQTNARLAEIQGTIQQTNSQLTDVHASLQHTDDHLVVVTGELAQTNPFLNSANSGLDRLRVLDEIQTSLNKTNAALLPLQKTMASLGGTMSFLGLGGDEPIADAAAPTEAATPTPESPAAQPSAQESDVHAADARSTARLLGTWILVHPAPTPTTSATGTQSTAVFVLLGTGRYLEGDNGKVRASGKWTRSGSTLTLTPDTKAAPTNFEIIGISARSLTVRSGDAFRVYARP